MANRKERNKKMSNEEYLNNMNVQHSPEENKDDYKDSSKSSYIKNNPELKRGVIARFLDSKIDTYNDRISSLKEKNELLNEKIQRNQSKINKFNSKISKLEKQNIFLKSIAQAYPQSENAINLLINKNINKINNLKTNKIPAKFEKIEKHKANIEYNENKIYKLQLKIKTCENIKEYFHSFSIKEPELRHDKFMNCLKSINDSSKFKLENILHKIKNLLERLIAKLETNRYMQKQVGDNPKMLEYLKSKEKSYLNKISKLERKIEKINIKLEKYQTLSKGIQGIEAEPPANKSQHIEEMMSKNESFNNSLAEIVVNLSEASIADRVILSNADIVSGLNIHISRTPVQTEKATAVKENMSEKQNHDSVNSDKITKDIFKFDEAKIYNNHAKVELTMNDALWERFAQHGLILNDTSINKVIFETVNNGFGNFYIPSSHPYIMPKYIPADKILTAAERSVIKDVTSKLLDTKQNNHEKKSLLGEIRHNQDKLAEKNKTADLSKITAKTAEVSL